MKFAIYGLAVWRLSRMLVKEPGPGLIFVKLREATGIEHDAKGEPAVWNDYTPLHCVFCTSIYISAVMLLVPDWFRRLLAGSAVAVLLEEMLDAT